MPTIDLNELRSYRYRRVQQQLIENHCAAALLGNPITIRYATKSRNMTVCDEGYIGEVGGTEQQALITETGHEIMSLFPLEDSLL
jgi:hypothetical protein